MLSMASRYQRVSLLQSKAASSGMHTYAEFLGDCNVFDYINGNVGTVSANPEQYDSEYLCPVQIGTPAQTLPLDFDTGSADL